MFDEGGYLVFDQVSDFSTSVKLVFKELLNFLK